MDEDRPTALEHFSVELFCEIFQYLAPHDLLCAFDNLNSRFSSVVSRHPLYLPNNQEMSRAVYHYYMTSVLPLRRSQIVYLHLSERHAPHAVDWFLETCVNLLPNFPLRALTIERVSRTTFEELLLHLHLFSRLESLRIDIGMWQWHDNEYFVVPDFHYVFPILKMLPQLAIFHMRREMIFPRLNVYQHLTIAAPVVQHLHTLSIEKCSYELFFQLLCDSLPQLCWLSVYLHHNHSGPFPVSTPLSPICLAKLRYVTLQNIMSLRWAITLFGDVYLHGQLTHIILSSHHILLKDEHILTAQELHQWLLMSTKCVLFRFNLTYCIYKGKNMLNAFLTEYKNIFDTRHRSLGATLPVGSFDLSLRYSKDTASHNVDSEIATLLDSSSSSMEDLCELRDDQIRLDSDGHASELEVAQFALNNALPLLIAMTKQAMTDRVRKLYINSNITKWLSSLIIATGDCSTKLLDDTNIEMVYLDNIKTSFVEIVHHVVALFGGVKKLKFSTAKASVLTADQLQLSIRLLLQGLSTLTHFSCLFHSKKSSSPIDFRQMSSTIIPRDLDRPVSFRCQRHIFNFWV